MKTPARCAVLWLVSFLPGVPLVAWGPTGHRVIAAVAESHLSEPAEAAAAELLDGASLARVSTWADDFRATPEGRHTETWHWIDVEDGETPQTRRRRPEGDLLDAVERFSAVLVDREAPREHRAEALKYLVHFVGDLHQPLHVGRRGDRGGNDVVVLWFGEASNLHRVWDVGLLEATALSYSEIVGFLGQPTAEEVAVWQASGPLDWARESQQARERVYDIGGGELGRAYQVRHQAWVEERLLRAGVRLAALLQRLLVGEEDEKNPPHGS